MATMLLIKNSKTCCVCYQIDCWRINRDNKTANWNYKLDLDIYLWQIKYVNVHGECSKSKHCPLFKKLTE